jgi:hypothetical protein
MKRTIERDVYTKKVISESFVEKNVCYSRFYNEEGDLQSEHFVRGLSPITYGQYLRFQKDNPKMPSPIRKPEKLKKYQVKDEHYDEHAYKRAIEANQENGRKFENSIDFRELGLLFGDVSAFRLRAYCLELISIGALGVKIFSDNGRSVLIVKLPQHENIRMKIYEFLYSGTIFEKIKVVDYLNIEFISLGISVISCLKN